MAHTPTIYSMIFLRFTTIPPLATILNGLEMHNLADENKTLLHKNDRLKHENDKLKRENSLQAENYVKGKSHFLITRPQYNKL